ncbi:MAG TPA: hypothetical protein VFQ22_12570, partial [Longimicrobiales bacterium]|nr:hypothetical protein [Longimicrobiales bacterium]
MSESTGAKRRVRDASPWIEAVRRHLSEWVDGPRRGPLLEFASIFLSRAPEAMLRGRDPADLAALVAGAFGLLESARDGRVRAVAFNPDGTQEGWSAPVTVVRTCVTERPFIVDTIREFLHGQGVPIEYLVYPLVEVEWDEKGGVARVGSPGEGTKLSLVHCETERIEPEALPGLVTELERHLQDVVRATDDFAPMLRAMEAVVDELGRLAHARPELAEELEEVRAFLRWLADGGFVFLGYRAYAVVEHEGEPSAVVEAGSGLGILRNEAQSSLAEPVPLSRLPAPMRALAEDAPLMIVTKSNALSTVHRRARMDYIGIRRTDAEGRTTGEHRFLGLFTSKAYQEAAEHIPILRRKLARVLEIARVRKGSHDYKAIITIFNSLPREELFVCSAEEIAEDVRAVLTSYGTDEVRVTLREDPLTSGLSVMVIMPRDRFSGDVRRAIEAALVQRLSGEVVNYHLALGEGDQARLHFHLAVPDSSVAASLDPAELERIVGQLIRTWTDLVEEGLERAAPELAAWRLARAYGLALGAEYQAATAPEVAVGDIRELEAMIEEGRDT